MNNESPIERIHWAAGSLNAVRDLVTSSKDLHAVDTDHLSHLLTLICDEIESGLNDIETRKSHLRSV